MVMETLQIRLSKKLLETIDSLIEEGVYSSRSDAIREAVRNTFYWRSQVGIIPDNGKDSVEEVREIRKKLSKELDSYEKIVAMEKSLGFRK